MDYSLFYFDKGNEAVYVKMDGVLRWIPNTTVWTALFAEAITPSKYQPYPSGMTTGMPLSSSARLVRQNDRSPIYLIDSYVWQPQTLVQRHIEYSDFNNWGFNWSTVQLYAPGQAPAQISVPVQVGNTDYQTMWTDAGLHALYSIYGQGLPDAQVAKQIPEYFKSLAAQYPYSQAVYSSICQQIKRALVNIWDPAVRNLINS